MKELNKDNFDEFLQMLLSAKGAKIRPLSSEEYLDIIGTGPSNSTKEIYGSQMPAFTVNPSTPETCQGCNACDTNHEPLGYPGQLDTTIDSSSSETSGQLTISVSGPETEDFLKDMEQWIRSEFYAGNGMTVSINKYITSDSKL